MYALLFNVKESLMPMLHGPPIACPKEGAWCYVTGTRDNFSSSVRHGTLCDDALIFNDYAEAKLFYLANVKGKEVGRYEHLEAYRVIKVKPITRTIMYEEIPQ